MIHCEKSQSDSPIGLWGYREFHELGICALAAFTHQTTIPTTTLIQCWQVGKQEWMTPILHRPTSMHWTTNHQSQILPLWSRRTQSHTRISLVHSIPTTCQLEERMDRHYLTSNCPQCTKCCKGKIYALIAERLTPSNWMILHWMCNHHCTSRKSSIKDPRGISTTS